LWSWGAWWCVGGGVGLLDGWRVRRHGFVGFLTGWWGKRASDVNLKG